MDTQQKLLSYLHNTYTDRSNLAIEAWRELAGGWESELYAFELRWDEAAQEQHQPLVLRMFSGESGGAKASLEFHGLQQLATQAYPVPAVYTLEQDPAVLGKPFLVEEFIPGVTLWEPLFRSEPAVRKALHTRFCELFVRLHRLDWLPFYVGQADSLPYDVGRTVSSLDSLFFVDQWLAVAHQDVARLQAPFFQPIVDWLDQRRATLTPFPTGPGVVHQDFHPSNILLSPDGRLTVIDWTNLSVNDPRLDLAWTLILAESYVSIEWRQYILDEYARLSGFPILDMDFFDVTACARRLASVLVSLTSSPEAMGMRADAVAQMTSPESLASHRKVYERMVHTTGIHINEIESAFTQLSH